MSSVSLTMKHLQYLASLCLMLLLLCLHTCSACLGSGNSEYKVTRKTDSDGKQLLVAVGDDARLSCVTNVPWKRCLWKPPRNGVRQLRCEFKAEGDNHWVCPSFPEVHFDHEHSVGEPIRACAIVVRQIEEHHEGNWRCEFEADVPEEKETVWIKDKVKLVARGWRYP